MVDVDDVVTDVVAENVIMGGALGRHYLCVLYSGVSLVVFWGQHNTSSRLQGWRLRVCTSSHGGVFVVAGR